MPKKGRADGICQRSDFPARNDICCSGDRRKRLTPTGCVGCCKLPYSLSDRRRVAERRRRSRSDAFAVGSRMSPNLKKIKVQYFAVFREQRGLGEEIVETGACTVGDLYSELGARH